MYKYFSLSPSESSLPLLTLFAVSTPVMLLENPQALVVAGLAILATVYIVRWKTHPLRSIPTVGGPSAPGLSILTALNFMRNGKEVLQEGYQKYHGSVFKVALLQHWMVVVSGPKMVDELRRRPDDELSFTEGTEEIMPLKYLVEPEVSESPYHLDVIKEKLSRALPAILPDVIEELKLAVPEHIPTKDAEWTTVNVMTSMQKIVARASNRIFVGLPLCRNEEYLDLAIRFTMDVVKDQVVMTLIPYSLTKYIGRLVSTTKRTIRQAMSHMGTVISERKANMEEFGEDWSDKPNDMLQWLIDEAVPRNHSDLSIGERIMLVNFAAIHTSSTSLTHVLYDLAAMPEWILPIREEIESVIATDGWSKLAMAKMWKLDSIFRESSRFHGIVMTTITRKALKDVTLSDGTFIPKGTLLAAAAHPTHHDESLYANADVFEPFRFAKMREGDGEGLKHQFVNTSVDYVSFGHGKHACPGRFFAANELKALASYILLNYDIKLGGDGKRPPNMYYSTNIVPSMSGQVLFRKRQTDSS
ncbi:cytochrome P450 [Ganoderma leucocontextum]|nr:cytochrome P450 [Ganoderma leucocontextum]